MNERERNKRVKEQEDRAIAEEIAVNAQIETAIEFWECQMVDNMLEDIFEQEMNHE